MLTDCSLEPCEVVWLGFTTPMVGKGFVLRVCSRGLGVASYSLEATDCSLEPCEVVWLGFTTPTVGKGFVFRVCSRGLGGASYSLEARSTCQPLFFMTRLLI